MKLLKHNDEERKDWTDTEWVEELYEFLQGKIPEGIHLVMGQKPKLSEKQAYAVIWYLQEHFQIIPDNIERCDVCGQFYDAYSEGLHWETKGKNYCDCCIHLVPKNYDRGKR